MSDYPEGGYWAWENSINEICPFTSTGWYPPRTHAPWPDGRPNTGIHKIVHVSDSHQVTRWEIVEDTRLQADDGTTPAGNAWLFNGRFDADGVSTGYTALILATLLGAKLHAWVSFTDPLNPIIYRWVTARRLQQIEDQ